MQQIYFKQTLFQKYEVNANIVLKQSLNHPRIV